MNAPDRTRLPIRRPPFQVVSNRTLDGSRPDWDLIRHPEPPEGAPNVLVVLIDDAGFGNPSTFGGPINTPRFTQIPFAFTGTVKKVAFDIKSHPSSDDEDALHTAAHHGHAGHGLSA